MEINILVLKISTILILNLFKFGASRAKRPKKRI